MPLIRLCRNYFRRGCSPPFSFIILFVPARAIVPALVAALISALSPVHAQRGPIFMGGTDLVVSSTVVASWIAHHDNGGPTQLDLLVLWRGTPGWFTRAGGGGGSNGGSTSRDGTQVVTMGINYGNIHYDLALDLQARRVTVGTREIVLGSNNVLLIDDVDREAGARVVGMQQIDPVIPNGGLGISQLLRQSRELTDYLAH
jgi:hypothetical protein